MSYDNRSQSSEDSQISLLAMIHIFAESELHMAEEMGDTKTSVQITLVFRCHHMSRRRCIFTVDKNHVSVLLYVVSISTQTSHI